MINWILRKIRRCTDCWARLEELQPKSHQHCRSCWGFRRMRIDPITGEILNWVKIPCPVPWPDCSPDGCHKCDGKGFTFGIRNQGLI